MPRRAPWKQYGQYKGRKTDFREFRQRFLIVCEGSKTEPNYFDSFKVPKSVVVDIASGAGVHISVVKEAIRRRDESSDAYDQVWCVFDRDKNPNSKQRFNEAIQLAKSNNIQIAYTNDAFELWYLLHFNYHDTAIHRRDYVKKLKTLVEGGYKKNDPSIYIKLEDKIDIASRNAKKLLAQYKPINPEQDDPSTTVHLLVAQLRRFSK